MRRWIENRLKELGKSKAELGRALGLPHARAHEIISGKRELKTHEIPAFAEFLSLSPLEVLEFYTGAKVAQFSTSQNQSVPLLSWVSAGCLNRDDTTQEALGVVNMSGLPDGDWIALRVDGDSMDRISPPESTIFVNRLDKSLITNGCYVIADEEGSATYKRYRSSPMRFEPVSTNPDHEPMFPDQEPTIIGRVCFSLLKM